MQDHAVPWPEITDTFQIREGSVRQRLPRVSSKISSYSQGPGQSEGRHSWWLDSLPSCQVTQPFKVKLHTTYEMKDSYLLA